MKAERQQAILELLHQAQSLTTESLAARLNVSIETIRRDLSALQQRGMIQRSHGQARIIRHDNHNNESPFQTRLKRHYAHKSDIARHALAWIEQGMTIALDASSTCWFLARQLPDIALTVFTNSHPVCVELGKRERVQLISSGGQLQRQFGYYLNPALASQLKGLEIDLFIFSCEGVDGDGILWDSSEHNARFKSLLLKRASQSLLLMDKSKFNRASVVRIGPLSEVTHLVSDAEPELAP
ncbi:L-fucose operon activator [[Enterobacter] lignolyticus]|uniref:Transcriptional regulator, DeoR family n=1 Tax=Enterobacter lignolyticus (strain SCF1) TaxID=701347 RepID=E3GCP9_ENTLS|nr:L-fucose operon activator [[Enterobacter] lignolyticus]ADO46742.1 transcriptional regulator, DeoR family [[Enterobacter] lignolyticus SCF1]